MKAGSTAARPETAAPSAAPAIEVQDLSASYRIRLDRGGALSDLRHLLTRRRSPERLVPALRDVTFAVPRGSVLAVVGRNGAGKSTLLRTIAGILAPDQGRVVVRGRVNLLSVGIGMSEHLTGRENVRLGGLAVGLPGDRLDEISDAIAAFAQLDEYIDYPIRTYSAGMRARLGFAVAAHLDPDILLIDEALTGGDAAFQAHVGEKMNELCGEGRTIVLVTHGLSTARKMATDAIWLHQGRVAAAGTPEEVVAGYMRYCRLEALTLDADDQ